MAERTTEQVPRSGRRPGFHMKPKHVGLVFCASLVGCMVAFGAGFIVGMGYKASEQVSPYVVKKSLTAESAEQQDVSSAGWEGGALDFIDPLIRNESVKMTPAAETIQAPEPTPPPPAPTPPVSAPPAPSVVPEETNGDLQAMAPVDVSPPDTDDSVVASYSVQVASVLTPEQATSLIEALTRKGHQAYIHPFEAPGQPLWYRVKVGRFTDRAAAELILQELRSRETPDAFITRN